MVEYLTDPATAARYVEQLAAEPVLGVDIETTGLDPLTDRVRLVSVATRAGTVAVFDLDRVGFEVLHPLSGRPWAVFNGSFEYRHLIRHLVVPPLHDVQLLDRLHTHRLHRRLADAVRDSLGIELDKSEQVSDWSAQELSREQIAYAGQDALVTVRAAAALLPPIERAGQRRLYDVWRGALPVLARLERDGMAFDFAQHATLVDSWRQEQDALHHQLREHLGAGVRPTSGPQLGEWFQQHLDATVLQRWPRTATGRLKTDADTLALFADHPMIRPLLRFKQVCKLLSTYGERYAAHRHPITGRFHPSLRIGQTVSGRVCSRHPNVQNPPRLDAFRALFAAAPGRVLIGADYSQIELRVAALLSGDAVMLEAYRRGDDLHRLTAAAVAGVAPEHVTKEQRTAAKAVNFGNLFGQGPAGLARTAQLDYGVDMSTKQAKAALQRFHATYPQLSAWKRQQIGLAQQFRQVRTRLGLIRDFDVQGEGYLQGEACNIPIQGSAAEVLLCALRRLPRELAGLEARLYHNVHDELLIEASEADAEAAANALSEAMVDGFLEVFPEAEALTAELVEVQTGRNWAAVH